MHWVCGVSNLFNWVGKWILCPLGSRGLGQQKGYLLRKQNHFPTILLMVQKSVTSNNQLGCIKPYKLWGKTTNLGRICEPSTVSFLKLRFDPSGIVILGDSRWYSKGFIDNFLVDMDGLTFDMALPSSQIYQSAIDPIWATSETHTTSI